jgi:hypothetical protein
MTLHDDFHARPVSLAGLLDKTVSGLWFLRNELTEFMDDENMSMLLHRLDDVYERAVRLQNDARPFTPSFCFRQDEDEKSVVHLLLLLPGAQLRSGPVAADVRMNAMVVGGRMALSLAVEARGHPVASAH